MINRNAFLVRIKQPYITWAASLEDGDGALPDLCGEPSMYLLPECRNESHALELLAQAFDTIFEAELFAWYLEPSAWPQDRSLPMFHEWFELTYVSLIVDLCEGPIIDSDT